MTSMAYLEPVPTGQVITIPPRNGVSFPLGANQTLTVIDPNGQQVSDLLAFARSDVRETLSNGRTFDYASKLLFSVGDVLYSNRSNVMLQIEADTVGKHDFLLTPCSKDTFRIIYGHEQPHRGCFGNLAEALEPWGVPEDSIPVAFNCFMNVPIDGATGKIDVLTPTSKAGDYIRFEAKMDLIMALTACSAEQSNGGSFKPIQFRVDDAK